MKLTEAQRRALQALSHGRALSSYRIGAGMNTLWALYRRGLLSMHSRPGSMAFPQTAIDWTITPAGRAALEASR
jgi:hypothetical protein